MIGSTIAASMTTARDFTAWHAMTDSRHMGHAEKNIPSRLLHIAREQPGQFWTQLPVVVLTVAYTLSTFVVHRPRSGYSGYWDGWVSNAAGILPLIPIALRAWRSRIARSLGVSRFRRRPLQRRKSHLPVSRSKPGTDTEPGTQRRGLSAVLRLFCDRHRHDDPALVRHRDSQHPPRRGGHGTRDRRGGGDAVV